MIENYYEEELHYLYESGKEFAKAHPDRAQFLDIDSISDRDPSVERLFEGFAFLSARIREKLEDVFPQLTEGVMNLLYPRVLQELPSVAIAQFSPRMGMVQKLRVLERGVEILSDAVSPENTVCRFVTTQDVNLFPLHLQGIDIEQAGQGLETIHFHFALEEGVLWRDCSVEELPLYLHTEFPTAILLYELLVGKVIEAQIKAKDGSFVHTLDPVTATSPGGISSATSLLPEDGRSFWGFGMLREFFAVPEKFLFVNLHGFSSLAATQGVQEITYSLTIAGSFPPHRLFGSDTFKLFCTPIINLYKQEVEPIHHSGKKGEYRVRADALHQDTVKVQSLVSVVGIEQGSGKRIAYESLYSGKHQVDPGEKRYYTRNKQSASGQTDLMLIIGGRQLDADNVMVAQNLSIVAWCSNGDLPRNFIKENGLSRGGRGFPDYCQVTNITRPTPVNRPPISSKYIHLFQTHLVMNLSSLCIGDNLKQLLRIYDSSGQESRKRKIEAIRSASCEPAEMVRGGTLIRGVTVRISFKESEFLNQGDIYLFGTILREFLSHFISINSFLKLEIGIGESAGSVHWIPFKGKRWLI